MPVDPVNDLSTADRGVFDTSGHKKRALEDPRFITIHLPVDRYLVS